MSRLFAAMGILLAAGNAAAAGTRAPAYPLVTHDPYFSVWSTVDEPYLDWPRHWTGAVQAMCGMVRVDGAPYFLLGGARTGQAAALKGVEVSATQTRYLFAAEGVELEMRFVSPVLLTPDSLEYFARPASYVVFGARAADGQPHRVELYFDATAEWAVHEARQQVEWSRAEAAGLDAMRIGTLEQPVLGRKGDDVRIDWGWFHMAVPKGMAAATAIGNADAMRPGFAQSGTLPGADDPGPPREARKDWPAMAAVYAWEVTAETPGEGYAMLAYDDLASIQYRGQPLRGWWRRAPETSAATLLESAARDYAALMTACGAFDAELAAAADAAGGPVYARLCALAYRQVAASGKVVASPAGTPWLFPKENFSNGCIGTVDVIYPAAPIFLHYHPDLVRAMIEPVLAYAESAAWPFPFAPHDLGTYPIADGQVYGDNKLEYQMPVEECGNMLILAAALAQRHDKGALAIRYWPLFTRWAAYLAGHGLDPANQLCTDDFAGHLARNANLSMKAIMGLRSYALLAWYKGDRETESKYREMAARYALTWQQLAADGDHTVLAFGNPGTWSMKYNLVWDRLLGFNLFPPEAAAREVAHYKRVQNRYGLPLDSRKDYTKLDWLVWCAALSETRDDFVALLEPVGAFLDDTPDRVPLTDWYDTKTAKKVGFQARPVVGGVFIRLLEPPK